MNPTTQPTLAEVGKLATNLMIDTLQRAGDLLVKAASLPVTIPSLPTLQLGKSCSCCDIPETQCPNRCVGPILLGAMTGQMVVAGVRIVNDAQETRTFTMSATPFFSGTASATFAFSPGSLVIPAGSSGFTSASVTIPTDFTKGIYQAEILATGAYEQCVLVNLQVGCDEMRSATVEIVQVEAPFRIRAHHWYDHFQCCEPCGPVHRQGTVGTVVGRQP